MVAKLLLLLALLSPGTPDSGAAPEIRLRLPEAPAALVAGSGLVAPVSTLRDGLNHRSGLELDPDGTPSQAPPAPPAGGFDAPGADRVHHRSPSRAVPLFSSSIPPPLPT